MAGIWAAVRTGEWLTPSRVRGYSIIVLALGIAMLAGLAVSGDGLSDYQGRPLGTDFSNVYAAGQWVLEGRPEAPFSPALQHEMEKRIFGASTPFYGWHYPPVFLGVAALLALMPYLVALVVWQAATLALYLWAMRAILRDAIPSPRLRGEGAERASASEAGEEATSQAQAGVDSPSPVRHRSALLRSADDPGSGPGQALSPQAGRGEMWWLLPALAFPAVLINISHGHNGFLSAALFGGGLVLLARRPRLAGILLGLLCYKPQLGALIPVALIAGRQWRAFMAAAAMVVALVILSWSVFGAGSWSAFRDSLEFTRTVVLEQGGTGFHKIQSPFAALRLIGAPVAVAYAAQLAAICTAAVLVFILWRSEVAFALKAAALLTGALIATPYVLDYDLMILAPAIAFFAAHGLKHGFLDHEKSALAFVWIAPLISRMAAETIFVPVGLIATLLLFGIVLRRAAVDRAALPPSSSRVYCPSEGPR